MKLITSLLLILPGLIFAGVEPQIIKTEGSLPTYSTSTQVNNFPLIYTITPGTGTYVVTSGSGTWLVMQGQVFTVTPGSGSWQINFTSGTQADPFFIRSTGVPVFQLGTWNINFASGTASNPFFFVSTGIPIFTTTPLQIYSTSTVALLTSSGAWSISQALSMRCVKADGSGFEACGGASTDNSTVWIASGSVISTHTLITSSGPWTVSQALSMRCVNTGGTAFESCGGAAAQTNTFIAQSTTVMLANKVHMQLWNQAGSGVTLKIQEVTLNPWIQGAITGLITSFYMVRSSGMANGVRITTATLMDTTGAGLNASVRISSGPSTTGMLLETPFGMTHFNPDETSTFPPPTYLYQFKNMGDMPLTLRAGQALSIHQGPLTSGAGFAATQIKFTQE